MIKFATKNNFVHFRDDCLKLIHSTTTAKQLLSILDKSTFYLSPFWNVMEKSDDFFFAFLKYNFAGPDVNVFDLKFSSEKSTTFAYFVSECVRSFIAEENIYVADIKEHQIKVSLIFFLYYF